MSTVHGRGRLTDGDRARIQDLAAQGLNAHAIAAAIRRHPATVGWYMYTSGLRAPRPMPENRRRSYQRGGVTIYRFTPEEDAFIEALRIQDFKPEEIAAHCSRRFSIMRSAHSVRCRLVMLAARDEEAA